MSGQKLLRRQTVEERTGTSRSFIYQGMQDGTFPLSIRIGPNSVAWLESEIDDWIETRIRDTRQPVEIGGDRITERHTGRTARQEPSGRPHKILSERVEG